jgi:hypothetical protein
MSQKVGHNVKKGTANTFGSFGYLFCFMQWFWAVMLYLTVIQSITLLISPSNTNHVEQSSSFTLTQSGPLRIVILAVVVSVMVVITIYALISLPKSIVKTGNKIVHKTAETITPLVIETQHKQDTKRRRVIITSKLMLIIKLLLILVPLLLAVASRLLEKQSIDYSIVLIIGCGLACCSAASFAIQYFLAKLLHVKISDLR